MPDAVHISSHLVFTTTRWGENYYYHHFTIRKLSVGNWGTVGPPAPHVMGFGNVFWERSVPASAPMLCSWEPFPHSHASRSSLSSRTKEENVARIPNSCHALVCRAYPWLLSLWKRSVTPKSLRTTNLGVKVTKTVNQHNQPFEDQDIDPFAYEEIHFPRLDGFLFSDLTKYFGVAKLQWKFIVRNSPKKWKVVIIYLLSCTIFSPNISSLCLFTERFQGNWKQLCLLLIQR